MSPLYDQEKGVETAATQITPLQQPKCESRGVEKRGAFCQWATVNDTDQEERPAQPIHEALMFHSGASNAKQFLEVEVDDVRCAAPDRRLGVDELPGACLSMTKHQWKFVRKKWWHRQGHVSFSKKG